MYAANDDAPYVRERVRVHPGLDAVVEGVLRKGLAIPCVHGEGARARVRAGGGRERDGALLLRVGEG